jgi:hypothetical protein
MMRENLDLSDINQVLHVIRNPYGWNEHVVRDARLKLADEFERLRAEVDALRAGNAKRDIELSAEYCPHCNPCRNGGRIAEAEQLNEAYDAVLRGLASYVGSGGFNDLQHFIDPKVADEKIRWGIDHIAGIEAARKGE